jgi:hypothetical protein
MSETIILRLILREDHIIKFTTVRHNTVDELKNEIMTRCDLDQAFELMYHDKEFQDFFTLTDMEVIGNLSSVKVMMKREATTAPGTGTEEMNTTPRTPIQTPANPSPAALNLRNKLTSEDYSLPDFDPDLQLLLQEANKKYKDTGEVTMLPHGPKSRILTRIVSNIYDKYTAYPTHDEMDIVAKLLVGVNPGVKSKVTDDGHEGWGNSLMFKIGNFRSEMRKRQAPDVSLNSGKRSKYNSAAPPARFGMKKGQRGQINWQPAMPQSVSEEKLREFQADMINEMKKSKPENVSEKMAMTFAIRRRDINTSSNSSDLVARWPALSMEREVSY